MVTKLKSMIFFIFVISMVILCNGCMSSDLFGHICQI